MTEEAQQPRDAVDIAKAYFQERSPATPAPTGVPPWVTQPFDVPRPHMPWGERAAMLADHEARLAELERRAGL